MLDHRVYRAAFIPAIAALFVAAFSLTDRPEPRTTRLAPLAFQVDRAFGTTRAPARDTLLELAAAFPDRRPGSTGDRRLADRVARALRTSGFAPTVRRTAFESDTVDGRRDLETVSATRQGLSDRSIVIVAHRDALAAPATAELSGTAVLLELARVFAGRDLPRTVVLASVSGGTGGFDGARRAVAAVRGPVDAVIVLGDLASARPVTPLVVPWSVGAKPAPLALERTLQSALRAETGTDPGGARAPAQLLRRALPLTASEQGPVGRAGFPAVLVSASSERRPPPDAPVSRDTMRELGRGVLRAVGATLEVRGGGPAYRGREGIVTMRRLVPDWAVRLLVLALVLPALIAALDAFFRVRRRGLPTERWLLWVGAWTLPVLAAWAWARLVAVSALVPVPGSPVLDGAVPLRGGAIAALATTVLAFAAAGWWAWRLTRRGGALREVAAGGAAAAAGLVLALLTGVTWIVDPYAALVLLPATHLWLLVTAPESRLRGAGAWAVAALGLAAPLLVLAGYMVVWSAGPLQAVWAVWGMVAAGTLGVKPMLALAVLFACLVTVATVLARRGRAWRDTPPDRLRTRGPASYAGPGSLGGTESALRR